MRIDFCFALSGLQFVWKTETQGVALGFPVLRFQRVLTLSVALLFCGCTHSLRPSNTPSDYTLTIAAENPEKYAVRIDGRNGEHKDYPVGTNGLVNFHVPMMPRGCAVRFLGVFKIADNRPEDLQAIELVKDGRTVRKLSLNEISKLDLDSNGVPRVKVK